MECTAAATVPCGAEEADPGSRLPIRRRALERGAVWENRPRILLKLNMGMLLSFGIAPA